MSSIIENAFSPKNPKCPYCHSAPFKTVCVSFQKHVASCRASYEKGAQEREEQMKKLKDEKLMLQDQFRDLKACLQAKGLDYETAAMFKAMTDKFESMAKVATTLEKQVEGMKTFIAEKASETQENIKVALQEENKSTQDLIKSEN